MWTRLSMLVAVLLAAPVASSAAEKSAGPQLTKPQRLFVKQVRPLLQKKCLGCHGKGDELEGELDLTTRAGLLKGGEEHGAAVVPGKPDKSPLLTGVLRRGDLKMPPKEKNQLSADEIDVLRQWITDGAPWVNDKLVAAWENAHSDGVQIKTSGGQSEDWTDRRYRHDSVWAYRPIGSPKPPSTASALSHPIDAFILARLNPHGGTLASTADLRTWLRRATFDLTGLPPTNRETKAFLDDKSRTAATKVIDRLLASQYYGERAAQHWLDVVRYADTAGYANDYERPNAWRYRDYVIRSFNADKPFDRFIVEQIAGDELASNNPRMLIATGFLRMGPWEHTGMSVAEVTRQLYLDDVTHSVGVTFLGHGLRCARCHDHKFDPVPTRDYYSIQAAFAPLQFAERSVQFLPEENTRGFEAGKRHAQEKLREAQATRTRYETKSSVAIAKLLGEKGVKNTSQLPKGEQPRKGQFGLTRVELTLNKGTNKRLAYFRRELGRYEPRALSVYNGPMRKYNSNAARFFMPPAEQRKASVQTIYVLKGGSLAAPGEVVQPGVLSAVPTPGKIPDQRHGRRLALARWIANPTNTLTARVIVNRVWQQHFGRGLVATSNNFGTNGSQPTHPELLDYLASRFIAEGWSIKKLHRLIMTSRTYQQRDHRPSIASIQEKDPNNTLLAYFPARRLSAEEIRDAMLAITGEINLTMGGPGVFPEINWEVAMQPRHIMGSIAPPYQPSLTPDERNRRTIYAFRTRTLADPMLEVLNRPGSDKSCERRDATTVTPQAFALFNGQFTHDRALALAARLAETSKDPADQVSQAFLAIYGRAPSDSQKKRSLQHVTSMIAHHQAHPPVKVKLPTSVHRAMVEELTGELVEWDEDLPRMKHYQRDLQPWDVSPEVRGLAELCLVLLNSNEFLYVR